MTAPLNPRVGRQRFLVGFLRVVLYVAFALGALSLIVPEEYRSDVGWAMVVLLMGVPLVRVAWLGVRWLRLGDVRFAVVTAILLAVIGIGVTLSI